MLILRAERAKIAAHGDADRAYLLGGVAISDVEIYAHWTAKYLATVLDARGRPGGASFVKHRDGDGDGWRLLAALSLISERNGRDIDVPGCEAQLIAGCLHGAPFFLWPSPAGSEANSLRRIGVTEGRLAKVWAAMEPALKEAFDEWR